MDSRSLLKLHEELVYFKSATAFTLHLTPKYLLEFHHALALKERPDLKRMAGRIDREMNAAYSRSVYVALKWLGFHHQLLQSAEIAIIKRATDSLGKLPAVSPRGNFQEYVNGKLVAPYRQYLLKLAAIVVSKASNDYSPRQQEGQASSFCLYNLVAYSLQEFPPAISQFSRYFERFFPCLNEYMGRIGKDLRPFIKRIRLDYEKGLLPMLTFLEVEQLEGQLAIFDRNAERFTNCWAFPETNAQSLNFEAEQEEEEEE